MVAEEGEVGVGGRLGNYFGCAIKSRRSGWSHRGMVTRLLEWSLGGCCIGLQGETQWEII